MGMNSLPKTVIRECHGCNLNTGPSAPESSLLTIRLLSHPTEMYNTILARSALELQVSIILLIDELRQITD